MQRYFFVCLLLQMSLLFNSPVSVPDGGFGVSSLTAYAVICGGTTSISPVQQASGTGSATQLLTSNGSSSLPSWQADGNTGTTNGLVFLKTYTASNSASLAFNSTDLSSTYKIFMIVLNNLQPSSSNVKLYAYWSTNNGSSLLTSGYSSGIIYMTYNSATVNNINNDADSNAYIVLSTSNSLYCSGILYLYGANGALSSGPALLGCVAADYPSVYNNIITKISGNPTINYMQFQFSSGNIASGSISLYGLT